MENERHLNIKVLDKIDLTGDEPVITKETVNQVVPVIDVDNDCSNNNSEIKIVKKTIKKMCEICLDSESKYTCPGCFVKTCCLDCVKKHKSLTSCTGERNKTGFVGKTQFNNLNLLSDYRFLEEASRLADNARRDPKSRRHDKLSRKENLVRNAARKRKIDIRYMSRGMKRSKENRSYYVVKKDELLWQVKLIFEDINEEILKQCSENLTIEEIIKPYTNKNIAIPQDKVKFSLYVNRCANEPVDVYYRNEYLTEQPNEVYTKCDLCKTLREVLENKTVIEYPIFYVTLPDSSKKLSNMTFNEKGKSTTNT